MPADTDTDELMAWEVAITFGHETAQAGKRAGQPGQHCPADRGADRRGARDHQADRRPEIEPQAQAIWAPLAMT